MYGSIAYMPKLTFSLDAETVATLRREKGHDISAACGQLRLQTKRAEGDPAISVSR